VAGVQLLDLDDRFRRMLNLPRTMRGALVANVAVGSPADLAGLRPGNVILEANREPIESAAAFARAYNERGGGITKECGEEIAIVACLR
jgi:S1-C subfamily serine protease